MELLLDRTGGGFGELFMGRSFVCYTLENIGKQITAGTYRVLLTLSDRAKRGVLWTPWPEFRLPLLEVPQREGIRIHSANRPEQLEGCIAVGKDRTQEMLTASRLALADLKDRLTFPCYITIQNPKEGTP